MTAPFADTFYWVALADFSDGAHRRALALTSERADSLLVTTDEVLVEHLWGIPQSRASHGSLPSTARQRLQPDGLHFDADGKLSPTNGILSRKVSGRCLGRSPAPCPAVFLNYRLSPAVKFRMTLKWSNPFSSSAMETRNRCPSADTVK